MDPRSIRLNRQDEKFIDELYRTHRGILYKTALECSGGRLEAESVVHDALLRIIGSLDTVKRLEEPARAVYLATTVRSVAYNALKKEAVREKHAADPPGDSWEDIPGGSNPEEELLAAENARAQVQYLREALAELDETDRLLLVGKYLAKETDAQLAYKLGIRESSVSMKLTRAKRRARKIIERKEAEDGRK